MSTAGKRRWVPPRKVTVPPEPSAATPGAAAPPRHLPVAAARATATDLPQHRHRTPRDGSAHGALTPRVLAPGVPLGGRAGSKLRRSAAAGGSPHPSGARHQRTQPATTALAAAADVLAATTTLATDAAGTVLGAGSTSRRRALTVRRKVPAIGKAPLTAVPVRAVSRAAPGTTSAANGTAASPQGSKTEAAPVVVTAEAPSTVPAAAATSVGSTRDTTCGTARANAQTPSAADATPPSASTAAQALTLAGGGTIDSNAATAPTTPASEQLTQTAGAVPTAKPYHHDAASTSTPKTNSKRPPAEPYKLMARNGQLPQAPALVNLALAYIGKHSQRWKRQAAEARERAARASAAAAAKRTRTEEEARDDEAASEGDEAPRGIPVALPSSGDDEASVAARSLSTTVTTRAGTMVTQCHAPVQTVSSPNPSGRDAAANEHSEPTWHAGTPEDNDDGVVDLCSEPGSEPRDETRASDSDDGASRSKSAQPAAVEGPGEVIDMTGDDPGDDPDPSSEPGLLGTGSASASSDLLSVPVPRAETDPRSSTRPPQSVSMPDSNAHSGEGPPPNAASPAHLSDAAMLGAPGSLCADADAADDRNMCELLELSVPGSLSWHRVAASLAQHLARGRCLTDDESSQWSALQGGWQSNFPPSDTSGATASVLGALELLGGRITLRGRLFVELDRGDSEARDHKGVGDIILAGHDDVDMPLDLATHARVEANRVAAEAVSVATIAVNTLGGLATGAGLAAARIASATSRACGPLMYAPAFSGHAGPSPARATTQQVAVLDALAGLRHIGEDACAHHVARVAVITSAPGAAVSQTAVTDALAIAFRGVTPAGRGPGAVPASAHSFGDSSLVPHSYGVCAIVSAVTSTHSSSRPDLLSAVDQTHSSSTDAGNTVLVYASADAHLFLWDASDGAAVSAGAGDDTDDTCEGQSSLLWFGGAYDGDAEIQPVGDLHSAAKDPGPCVSGTMSGGLQSSGMSRLATWIHNAFFWRGAGAGAAMPASAPGLRVEVLQRLASVPLARDAEDACTRYQV